MADSGCPAPDGADAGAASLKGGGHERTVRNAERGTYGPSRATLEKLRAVLGDC